MTNGLMVAGGLVALIAAAEVLVRGLSDIRNSSLECVEYLATAIVTSWMESGARFNHGLKGNGCHW
jgi:hypothetical protein